MIENKLVTIKKNNSFDKGWALFEKYDVHVVNVTEEAAKTISATDVVQAITFSKSVDILLNSPCLSGNVISELQWVASRGVKVRLIAQNQDIIDKYSSINFAETEVRTLVTVNYLAIFGEKPIYVLISDHFITYNGSIWLTFFGDKNANSWYEQMVDGATRVIVIEKEPTAVYKQYIDECLRQNVPVDYVVPISKFTQKLCRSTPRGVNLCVSTKTTNIIMTIGKYFAYNKDSVRYFCGELYRNLRLDDNVSTNEVKTGTYCCLNGEIKPLVIGDTKVVKRTVQVPLMSEFVAEQFDRSETDSHNEYSAEVKSVEYQYTLVPPKFDESYSLSTLYVPLKGLYDMWKKLQSYNLSEVRKTLAAIVAQCDLLKLMDQLLQFDEWLADAVGKYSYRNFSKNVGKCGKVVADALDRYQQYFEQIFVNINGDTSSSKFDKLDAEIQGFSRKIEEKQQLVDQDRNALSNKQEIERLKEKIAQLEKIKQSFASKAMGQISKELEEYKSKCAKILDGSLSESVNDDSIGNVIHQSKSKAEIFEAFTANYLVSLRNYLQKVKWLVDQFAQQDIPEDYVVYDRDGEHYIVIDDLSEYETTMPIQEKYQLKCLARR